MGGWERLEKKFRGFKVLAKKGIGILVSKNARKTFAQYRLESPKDVVKLLRAL